MDHSSRSATDMLNDTTDAAEPQALAKKPTGKGFFAPKEAASAKPALRLVQDAGCYPSEDGHKKLLLNLLNSFEYPDNWDAMKRGGPARAIALLAWAHASEEFKGTFLPYRVVTSVINDEKTLYKDTDALTGQVLRMATKIYQRVKDEHGLLVVAGNNHVRFASDATAWANYYTRKVARQTADAKRLMHMVPEAEAEALIAEGLVPAESRAIRANINLLGAQVPLKALLGEGGTEK